MELGLSESAFAKLLASLSADREQAGEKYEHLRRTLIKFFEWRSAPFPEEQADETFNRVARKLEEGVQVKNIGAYCYEVARLVCLESFKSHDTKRSPLDVLKGDASVASSSDESLEKELRLSCLDTCLGELPSESRELIVAYYQDDRRSRIDHRKALALRVGLRRDALANRAQRLRDKLEQCVAKCIRKTA